MFAKVKRIVKPIRRKDFYRPSGRPVLPKSHFLFYGSVPNKDKTLPCYGYWQFKNIPISGLNELVEIGDLIICRRVEIKVELRRSVRSGKKVSSNTWYLASMLERDIADPIKCESFWNKVEDKLKNFELKDAEREAIRGKISAVVPMPNEKVEGCVQGCPDVGIA